jgi:hypothetical protein
VWANQFLAPLGAHLQPLFTVNAVGALAVDHLPLDPEHVVQGRVPIARVALSQCLEPLAQLGVVAAFQPVPGCRSAKAYQPAGTALTEAAPLEVIYGPAPLRSRHHFA